MMSSRIQYPSKVSVQLLGPDHYEPLVGAIRNVLSSDLAELTLAQLIDGLPLIDTVWDMKGALIRRGHPLISHNALCEGAMEQANMFRDTFDPAALQLYSPVFAHIAPVPPLFSSPRGQKNAK